MKPYTWFYAGLKQLSPARSDALVSSACSATAIPESLGFPITPSPIGVPGDVEGHELSPLGRFCSCLAFFSGDKFCFPSALH